MLPRSSGVPLLVQKTRWERVGRAPVPSYIATAVTDRHGRTLAEVVEQQRKAVSVVEQLDAIVASIKSGEVLLIRAAGQRLIRRLEVSANAFDHIAHRDARIAMEL